MSQDELQNLLDQIVWLDHVATKGPWITGENDDTGLKYFGTGYCDCCTPPIPSAGVILGETGRAEAEFIALARTALPKLAEAVYHVLDLLDVVEKSDKYAYELGGNKSPSLVTTNEVRRAITDAIGDDDD